LLSILLVALSFTLINADCTSALGNYGICTATAITAKSKCDCLKSYLDIASTQCTLPTDKLAVVVTCNTLAPICPGISCDNFCGALLDQIPGFKTTFDTCTNSSTINVCTCYDNLEAAISQWGVCSLTQQTELSACVRAQLDCGTLSCVPSINIPLTDLKTYFDKYVDKFITLWNSALAAAQTTIATVLYELKESQFIWTLTVTWDNSTTIEIVVQKVKEEFSKTVGFKITDLTATYSLSAKRSVLANEGEIVLKTGGSSTSDGVSLNVLLTPFVILNILLFLFFNLKQ